MKYEANTPKEYMQCLEKDWRLERVQELRTLIKKTLPKTKECISYDMLGFEYEKEMIFHLNAQKNYVALYVGNIKKLDEDGQLLQGLDCGKSCVRFKKKSELNSSNIKKLILKAKELKDLGISTGC